MMPIELGTWVILASPCDEEMYGRIEIGKSSIPSGTGSMSDVLIYCLSTKEMTWIFHRMYCFCFGLVFVLFWFVLWWEENKGGDMDLYLNTMSLNKHRLRSISARKVEKHPELMWKLLRLLLISFWSCLGKVHGWKKYPSFSHLQESDRTGISGKQKLMEKKKKGGHYKNKPCVVIS